MLLVFVGLVAGGVHHDSRLVFGAQQGVDGPLVFDATVAVIDHHLCLHSVGLNLFAEMVDNIFADLIDTLLRGKKGFDRSATHEFVLFFFADLVSQFVKCFLKFFLIEMHRHRHSLEV